MRILLVTCFAWAVSGRQLSTLAARHWDDWIYTKEAHHWHSLWCRWQPTGEEAHPATLERIFTPTDDGNSHKNIYHFEDECGTVSEGRMCGPWYMTQEMSPTLAWCTRSLPSARRCSSQVDS